MRRRPGLLGDDRGVAALEFALILPLLLGIIAGILEYGRVMFAQNAIRAIIDEAARHAVVRGYTAAEVEESVTDDVADVTAIEDTVVTVAESTCNLSVTVSGKFDLVITGLLPEDLRDKISFSLTAAYPKC